MSAEAIASPPTPVPPPILRVVVPAPYVPVQLCACGHETDAHGHLGDGAGCQVCGAVRCRRFRRRTGRGARSSVRR